MRLSVERVGRWEYLHARVCGFFADVGLPWSVWVVLVAGALAWGVYV